MKRLTFPTALSPIPRSVALGFFDGVHLGHRAVLRRAIDSAGLNGTVTVFTFDTLPKLDNHRLLLPREETDRRLEAMGITERIEANFAALQNLTPGAFVRDILKNALHATTVCCGENFRFGQGGQGDAAALQHWGQVFGIEVEVLPLTMADTVPISSSRIRCALEAGDMPTVNRLLGHPYEVTAPVIDGAHLGRTLGTPTINQPLGSERTLPAFGVYASAVEIGERVYYGVTNVGVKPTVGGTTPLAETWIPDFEGDLYGQAVPVYPVAFLRPERTFPSVEELRGQILADAEAARALLVEGGQKRAVLFDFDDTLQNRQIAFLAFSRWFVEHHFPALSAKEKEQRAHEMYRLNAGGYGFSSYAAFWEAVVAAFDWQDAPPLAVLETESKNYFPNHTTLLPGVVDGLRALRERGWLLGIITNGNSQIQNKKLDVSGLRPWFDVVCVAGDEGIAKPNPSIFRRAAARLGLPPHDCFFVGDHPVNDIQGATAAGMHPVFMQASGTLPPPPNVPLVHSMAELVAYLATI